MPFSTLGLSPALSQPLAARGYRVPTPVQAAAIPLALAGTDLVARAQTGTGKTAAFGLPMIERFRESGRRASPGQPRGLVLVPTRELAVQVGRALAAYGMPLQIRIAEVFGGVPMGRQIQALKRGPDIVVATPGRLIDHLQRRTIDLSAVEILTLDEADRMLDMGFIAPLRRVLAALPRRRQTLLFTATLTAAVEQLSGEFTTAAQRIDISGDDVVASTVTHQVHPVSSDRKRALLLHLLGEVPGDQALVFCRTKRGADRVGDHLKGAGMKVAVIHGNKGQGARNRSLDDFRSGRVAVLVATDIAARGLDIARLPLVINFDLPLAAEEYVHRVGRTGRAGAAGRAVSLATAGDAPLLRAIQRLLPEPVEQVAVAGFEGTESLAESLKAERPRPMGSPSRRPRHLGRRGASSGGWRGRARY